MDEPEQWRWIWLGTAVLFGVGVVALARPSRFARGLPLVHVPTSMLAMDLYLPAVPALQSGLDLTVPEGQATIAVFLAGLAGFLWGEFVSRPFFMRGMAALAGDFTTFLHRHGSESAF